MGKIEDSLQNNTALRAMLCRMAFAFISLTLVCSYWLHLTVHQLQSPVLIYPYVDPTYWILILTKIPHLLSGNYYIALAFDLLLFSSTILIIRYPFKRWLVYIFFILYSLYFFTLNIFGAHHAHPKIGILLVSGVFLFKEKHFPFIWQGLRYFAAFIFVDAFLWKLFRGSIMHKDQGLLIIKRNITPYLLYHKDTLKAQFYQFLLQHPLLTNTLYKTGILLEGIFVIAFFSTKWDKYLLLVLLLLPVGFFLFADAYFFEMWILSLAFIPLKSYSNKFLNSRINPLQESGHL